VLINSPYLIRRTRALETPVPQNAPIENRRGREGAYDRGMNGPRWERRLFLYDL